MAGGQLPFGLAPSGDLTSYTPTLREKAADWLRQKMFTDNRAGQDKANRLVNWGETMLPPFGFATSMYDAGNQAGRGNYGAAALTAGMAAMPGPDFERKGIRAFHGSPHSFDKFSMDKIGTGEGAQAYGHGLYFAENEGVARGYRDALAPAPTAAQDEAQRAINQFGDPKAAADHIATFIETNGANLFPETLDHYKQVESILRNGSHAPGSMYEVNINADPNHFLDWDKPLSEQSDKVRQWFDSRGITPGFAGQQSGAELFTAERGALGDAGVAANMRDAGLAGVKYLDHGSRFNAIDGVGQNTSTRNYVVFDDKLVSIVKKYGIAGASAMLGYNILNGLSDAQAAELKKQEGK